MSQNDFFEQEQDFLDVDELIRSTKEDLYTGTPMATPETYEPQTEDFDAEGDLPAEYADLVSEPENEEPPEDADTGRIPGVVKALLYVGLVLVASVLLAVFAWKCADEVCALTSEDEVVTVTVEENARMSDIVAMLHDKGLIEYKWLFKLYCMISGAEEKIDPGTYELNAVYDYRALVYGMIETGENRATRTVTVPEGYELDDIFEMLEQMEVCDAELLRQTAAEYVFDYWFLEELPYGDYRRLEGYLFPDTYEFYVDDDPEKVLKRFLRNFDNKITVEMQAAVKALNLDLEQQMTAAGFTEEEIAAGQLTFHDVVIIASLVEKESYTVTEAGSIASVIYNRLCSRTYPCLNMDSTIQYVLPERKEILTNADKAVISPYNTYTNAGLPVGPIANPGMNALRAALHPANTNYHFYALDPSGVHHFSETVYEHQLYLQSLLEPEEQPEETPVEQEGEETQTAEE